VDPSARGRGVGRNTLRSIFASGFDDGLMRIEALVDPENLSSMRMVAAAGMSNEGISASVLELDGVRVDAARWAVVAGRS
jgi:RimJ/RimL family protein N-acetyltransferase